jgi:uncharacterized membrane protein
LALLIVLSSSCASLPSRQRGPATAAACRLPKKGEPLPPETRTECLRMASVWEAQPQGLTPDDVLAGPPSSLRFSSADEVYCRLRPTPRHENSLKFRCLRTDSSGALFNAGGALVPQAAEADAQGHLVDAQGRVIQDSKGRPQEGDELKVKYFIGQYPEPRYREMFTENAGSRILWMLGLPTDRNYLPTAVHCYGCGPDPFNEEQAFDYKIAHRFELASIKRRLEGKTIETKEGEGFAVPDLRGLIEGDPARIAELDAALLAVHLIGMEHVPYYQNRLACRKGALNKQTGQCGETVAYFSDIGGSFRREGSGGERGNLLGWRGNRVFEDASSCTIYADETMYPRVGEAGRRLLAERLQKVTRPLVRAAFAAARMDRMDAEANAQIARESGANGKGLADRVIDAWTDEVMKRREEILGARCPN